MKARLTLTANLRINGQLFHPGVYRVPQDVSEEVADVAVKAGATLEQEGVVRPVRTVLAPRRRRKTPAPENKALEADETK